MKKTHFKTILQRLGAILTLVGIPTLTSATPALSWLFWLGQVLIILSTLKPPDQE